MKKLNEYAKDNNLPDLKLHLGCGAVYHNGWINVDFYDNDQPDFSRGYGELKADVLLDILKLEKFVDAGTVDHILLVHVMEHFTRWNTLKLLKSYYEVLKPGGLVEMEHPDLDQVIHFYLNKTSTHNTPLGPKNIGFTQFYGNQWDELDYETHRYVWTKPEMKQVCEEIGFTVVELSNNTKHGHVPGRDMRVVLKK